jgi:hypothetical protein
MRLLLPALLLTLMVWVIVAGMVLIANTAGQPVIEQTATLLRTALDCPAPCWQGIRPGSTNSSAGIDRLNQMPWITDLSVIQGIVSYDSVVRWAWQQPPNGIDGSRDGRMWTHQGQVYLIELPLTLNLATVWNALGPPDWIALTRSPQQPPAVFLHAYYDAGRLELDGMVECPVNWWGIWMTPVDAQFQDAPRSPPSDSGGEPYSPCPAA